jgi:hypothetical protein
MAKIDMPPMKDAKSVKIKVKFDGKKSDKNARKAEKKSDRSGGR